MSKKIDSEMIKVLDKGYLRLVDKMGTDLSVVNSARVSYSKASEALTEADGKLIKYLAEHEHTSPFRHAMLQFEVYAPLMVARQWWKHVVGSDHIMEAWNESSRRYITEEPVFYIPSSSEWREKPEHNKQGSGMNLVDTSGEIWTSKLQQYIEQGEALYEEALACGVCAEQARLFLPAYGMYVRWYWTCSLQSAIHFIQLRKESHAQKEIVVYAEAVEHFVKEHFPVSIDAMLSE